MKIWTKIILINIVCLNLAACTSSNKKLDKPTENPTKPDDNTTIQETPINITLPEINFTDPKTIYQGNYSFTIINRFIDLLNATPKEDSVFFSMYMFSYAPAIKAITEADARGVKMYILLDSSRDESISSSNATYPAMRILKKAVYRSVINDLGSVGSNGINHNKFAIFSSVHTTHDGILKNVVFQTSNNFTQTQCSYFQDNIILSNPELFHVYKNTWWDIYLHAKSNISGYQYREYQNADSTLKSYFFPKIKNGAYFAPDPIVDLLQQVSAPSQTQVRILMASWTNTRSGILDALNTLLARGAKVKIIISDEAATDLGNSLDRLKNNGAEIRVFDILGGNFKKSVHSKYLLIDGPVNGKPAKIVATGSENYTGSALTTNNETLLQFNDPNIYKVYLNNFETINNL